MSTSDTMSWLRRAGSGDRAALVRVFERTRGALWPLCWRGVGGHRQDAEDVMQETVLRALRSQRTYREDGSVDAWLRGIAIRVLADHHRRRREVSAQEDAAVDGSSPIEALTGHERREALERALLELDATTRSLLRLRYGQGLSREELGRATGLSVEAVKKRMTRARESLRRRLGLTEPARTHPEGGDDDLR